jgi:hypothetical protein
VTLDASASTDSNVPPMAMLYTWQQLTGPVVTMLNVNNTQWTQQFIAPTLAAGAAPVTITVQLAVCNGFTCGGSTTVNITVIATPPPPPPPAPPTAPSVTLSSAKKDSKTGLQVSANQGVIWNTDTVTLTAAPLCGGKACPVGTPALVWAQTSGDAQPWTVVKGNPNQISFKATSGAAFRAGTPEKLSFSASQTSAGVKVTQGIDLYAGADTITVANVVYQLAHSKLQVAASTNSLPKGQAILIVTPMVNGKASGPDIVCQYDPILDSYNVLADITNPIPDAVTVRSNYGASVIAPLTRIL